MAVYRLGHPFAGHNRLLKVVLPVSCFQKLAVMRAPWLRYFLDGGVLLRQSVTLEKMKRRREERINCVNVTSHSSQIPEAVTVIPLRETSFPSPKNLFAVLR